MNRTRICLAVASALLAGCSHEPASQVPPTAQSRSRIAIKIDAPHLPNAFRLHEKVISGGQPEGPAAFQELERLGVKTIISVDGAKPDVAAAKQFGMRYVHLPHGYDGVPQRRVKELAKAVRDLPGPIYIHCHHGKHRSPAAATVACVSIGLLQPQDAAGVLAVAGTSKNYRGLYESAETARPIDGALLDALEADFRETVELPPLAEAMVAIEHVHDHLKEMAEAQWQPDARHPDLEAAHEALLLREHFTELPRDDEVSRRPAEFLALLRESTVAAGELEDALRAEPRDAAAAPKAFQRVTALCAACHAQFRDVPLGEKNAR